MALFLPLDPNMRLLPNLHKTIFHTPMMFDKALKIKRPQSFLNLNAFSSELFR